MDIRLDANEAWRAYELINRVQPLRRFRPTAIEQPFSTPTWTPSRNCVHSSEFRSCSTSHSADSPTPRRP